MQCKTESAASTDSNANGKNSTRGAVTLVGNSRKGRETEMKQYYKRDLKNTYLMIEQEEQEKSCAKERNGQNNYSKNCKLHSILL